METQADAEKAFDLCVKTYEPGYPKVTVSLDREGLMAFQGFRHSSDGDFGPVIRPGLLTGRSAMDQAPQGCLLCDGMLQRMIKPGLCARKKWRKLCGFDYREKAVTGIQFNEGIEVIEADHADACCKWLDSCFYNCSSITD